MTSSTPRLSNPIVGDGLLLRYEDEGLTLHAFAGGTTHRLGTYADVRAAWKAVDEIDLTEVDAGLAAAA